MSYYQFLDTSAVLNGMLNNYEHPYISTIVLQELEKIKNDAHKSEEVKYQARKATKSIIENKQIAIVPYDRKKIDKFLKKYDSTLTDNNDSRLIAEAALIDKSGLSTTFITCDYAQYVLAKTFIPSEIAFKKEQTEEPYTGWKKVYPSDEEFISVYTHPENNVFNCLINQYVELFEGDVLKDLVVWTGEKYESVKWQNIRNPYTQEIIKPRNTKQKMAMNMLQNEKIKVALLTARFGAGKAQPVTTTIPTPEGMRKLGDIQIGDYVFDRFGNPTKVLGVFPQGTLDCYKITFNDGRTSYCNDEHIWSYYNRNRQLKQATVREMLEQGIYTKNSKDTNVYRYKIPLNDAVNYSTKNYEVDPYVIGCFVGDGCCLEKALTISSNDEEIVSTIAKLINAKAYKRNSLRNCSWNFYLKDEDEYKNLVKSSNKQFLTESFFKNYPSMISYAKDKAIPEEYLYGDIEQRFSLLQGLMDTDGSIDDTKGRLRFFTTSIKLKEQVKQLVWSLGYLCFESVDTRVEGVHKNVCYGLSIGAPVEDKPYFFRLTRKKQRAIDNTAHRKVSHSSSLTIKNIEKMPYQEEMVCLYVDNEEHLYLTNDFIVTHNTVLALNYALSQIEKGAYDKIIYLRNNIIVKNTNDVGFMPGTLPEKMLIWGLPMAAHLGGVEVLEQLIKEGLIEIFPISHIRGLSIKNSIVLCDECENLDDKLVALIISRIEESSKLIFCGDYAQTDTKYFEENNGVRAMLERLKGEPKFGAVKLMKTERGETAVLADKITSK